MGDSIPFVCDEILDEKDPKRITVYDTMVEKKNKNVQNMNTIRFLCRDEVNDFLKGHDSQRDISDMTLPFLIEVYDTLKEETDTKEDEPEFLFVISVCESSRKGRT